MRKVSFKLKLVLLLAACCFADTVSKFAYIGSLIPLNGKTIEMSPKVVGMSEYVYVQKILDQLTIKDPCSLMFIIDNSGTNTDNPTDLNAGKYVVTIHAANNRVCSMRFAVTQ